MLSLSLSLPRRLFSSWVYSSKFDELSSRSLGKLTLSPLPSHLHDTTLRLHQHIFLSDIILCENYKTCASYLYSLKNKLSTIEPCPQSETYDLTLSPDLSPPTATASDTLLELSEHLKYNQELSHLSSLPFSPQHMLSQHQSILSYNTILAFKSHLSHFKNTHGYPYLIELSPSSPFPPILSYLHYPLNITYLHPEPTQYLKTFLHHVHEGGYPYEILPGPSELIGDLAASGFPADRFGVAYFLGEMGEGKMEEVLRVRKRQCFTVCLYEEEERAERVLRKVEKVYGEKQMVYVRRHGEQGGRGEVSTIRQLLSSTPSPTPTSPTSPPFLTIIISPYAISYNSSYNTLEFQKHYLNELIHSSDTTLYEVQKLTKKLQDMKEEKKYEIDSIQAARYLLGIMEEEDVVEVLRGLLRVGAEETRRIVGEARKMPGDVLGLAKGKTRGRKQLELE